MNYIIHLNKAFALFCEDERLTPFHVSLYFGLFQYWNMAKFRNPISISRDELMRASKIGSVNTYIRSIKDLHNWNYIKYIPSYNPQKGSQVYLYTFDNSNNNSNDNSLNNGSDISDSTGFNKADKKAVGKANEKPVIPSINSSNKTNKLNSKNEYGHTSKKNNSKSDLVITKLFTREMENKEKKVAPKKRKSDNNSGATSNPSKKESEESKSQKDSKAGAKKSAGKKSSKNNSANTRFKRPLLNTVKNYFEENSWPAIEAEKFFNYYKGNGWLVGGKTPMQSWQACAANWIINSEKFNNGKEKPKSGKLAVTNQKDYSEPL